MSTKLARDPSGISNFGTFVVFLIAIALALTAYYVWLVPVRPSDVRIAEEGDSVSVDYVGYFADTNLIFDTSIESVARDNASFHKAVSFAWRARWQPLSFRVGDGSVVIGFNEGVRGLALGASSTVIVSAEEGYGPMDPDLVQVRPLLESVPVRLTLNATEFQAKYSTAPASGIKVTDPFWGWEAIVEVSGSIVRVTNSPELGEIVRPYDAWEAEVISIDDAASAGAGEIIVRHRIDTGMANRLGGKSNGQAFYVSAVDVDAGTYTMNYNREVVGRTLVFQVTLRSLFRI